MVDLDLDFYEDDDFYDDDDEYVEIGDVVDESISEDIVVAPSNSVSSSVTVSTELEDDSTMSVDSTSGGSTDTPETVGVTKRVFTFELEDDDEDDKKSNKGGDVLTKEEQARYYADKVISAIVGGKSISQYAMGRLLSATSPRLFRDENYIIFSIFYNYRDRIKSINLDSEFVSLYLDNNRKVVDGARGYIDIHSYGEIDGSETLGYIAGVVKHFNRLVGMEDMTEAEFNLYFEKYLIVFKALEAQKVYAQSNLILTEGLKMGNKLLSGFEDSFNYSRRKLAEIEGLVDMNLGSGFISMKDVLNSKRDDSKKSVKIADFDKLEKLTEYYGGIYTGNFYQVMAPNKSGKSKFCARVCHTTTVKFGHNVTVWAHEGGYEAWSAQMRAIHFDYTYNEGVSHLEKKYGVSQDVILKDSFDSQELRDLELTSKTDLASNTEYGNIDYIDRPFNVETFLEEIDTSVKANNSKLIIIDYLQLIGSENTRLSERERISQAYKSLLSYCKKNNVAVLTPAQYKQDSIDALASKGDTSTAEMRTAGGGSSEVLRTPDITFAFWASTEDLNNNSLSILSMPCRFNKPFPEIKCYIDLSVCQFISLEE